MCTALPLDEIYPPTKFHNHSKYSFGDMLRTKIKYENTQKAINENLSMKKKKKNQRAITEKLSKQELRFMCTALLLDEIYPPTEFHNYS